MPIGRLFYEIGGSTDKLNAALRQSQEALKEAGVQATRAGQSIISKFDEALNPTKKLAEELELLQKAGKSNSDIIKVYGDRIGKATEQAKLHGQAVPPVVTNLNKLREGTEKSTGIFNKFTQSLGTAQKALLGLGIGVGIVSAIRGLKNLGEQAIKMAMDAVESENLFAVSMGNMAQTAVDWSKDLSSALGLNEYELRKNIGTLNVMMKSMGLSEQAAYDMAKGLTQLTYDMASFYNLRPEEAFQKLQAGISGETEPLKRLGILVSENTIKTYAYKNGIAELGEQLTEQQKVMARYGAIMEQTATAQGDMARTLESPANLLRTLQARVDMLLTQLGTAFLPTLQAVVGELIIFTDALDTNAEAIKLLAIEIAAPLIYYIKLGQILADINVAMWEFELRVDKLVGREITRDTIEAYKEATASAAKWNEKAQQLYESIEAIGSYSYDAAKAAAMVAMQQNEAVISTENYNNALDKTRDYTEKALRPMNNLSETLSKQMEFYSKEDIVARYHKEIMKAASEQIKFGGELSKTQIALYEAALEYEHFNKEIKAGTGLIPKASDELHDLKGDIEEIKKEAEAAQKKLESMHAELEKRWGIPETQIGFTPKDFLEGLPTVEEINDFRREVGMIPEEVGESERAFESLGYQVSTVFTDLSRDLAENTLEWDSWSDTILDTLKDFGKAALRMLYETLFNPLAQIMQGLANSFSSWLSSIFGGGKAGGGLNIGNLLGAGGNLGLSILMGGLPLTLGLTQAENPFAQAGGILGSSLLGMAGLTSVFTEMPLMTAMKMMFTNPYTMIAGGAIAGGYGISKLIDWAAGKTTFEAADKELTRDFAVAVTEKQMKAIFEEMGISEHAGYGIRKDILSSPWFLANITGPLAQQQGLFDEFLKKLEAVETSWGTFDFRQAFETGWATGNWQALNEAFLAAWGPEHLAEIEKRVPDWEEKLLAVSKATEELTESNLGLADSFEEMVQHFRDTGEVLPKLREMMKALGADMMAFDTAVSTVEKLKGTISAISDLQAGLLRIQPIKSPIEQILAGEWGPQTWGQLAGLGLDPSKLARITELIKFETGWEQAAREFQQSGKILSGGLLEQALYQFGGSAGITALQRYAEGFNTVTPQLLEATKAAMDVAYQAERATVMDYLEGLAEDTTKAIEAAEEVIDKQLELVSEKIVNAIETGNSEIIDLLTQIRDGQRQEELTAAPPSQYDNGRTLQPLGRQQLILVHYGDNYGYEDWLSMIGQAGYELARREGY